MTIDEHAKCPSVSRFDPLSPLFLTDPFAVFNSLPSDTPVFYAPSIDYYVVTRTLKRFFSTQTHTPPLPLSCHLCSSFLRQPTSCSEVGIRPNPPWLALIRRLTLAYGLRQHGRSQRVVLRRWSRRSEGPSTSC